MAVTDRNGLKTQITVLLPDNSTRQISAADVRAVFGDYADSLLTLQDDGKRFALVYRTDRNYQLGEGVVYQGALYTCTTPTIGAFNSAHWKREFEFQQGSVEGTIGNWDNQASYTGGEVVLFMDRLFQASNVTPPGAGVPPLPSTPAWVELSPPGPFGGEWIADTVYAFGDVVTGEGNLYRCTVSPFLVSFDLEAEIAANQWEGLVDASLTEADRNVLNLILHSYLR